METRRLPQTCRWAQPTLFLPLPYWLEAWNTPWTCERDGVPRHLESTHECADCPRFEPRGHAEKSWALAQVGL